MLSKMAEGLTRKTRLLGERESVGRGRAGHRQINWKGSEDEVAVQSQVG